MCPAQPKLTRALLLALLLCGAAQVSRGQSYPEVPAEVGSVPPSTGRSQPVDSLQTTVPEDLVNSPLNEGYLLRMEIYGAPDMSAQLRVDTNGDITVPLVGPVRVAGLTVVEAQRAIARALVRNEILRNPQVTLTVLQYATSTTTVLGEVQTPGRVQLAGPKNLEEVLALAGGETFAAGNIIEIDHQDAPPTFVKYSQGENREYLRGVIVRKGDSVYVRRAGVIYVLGAVNRPGGYLMINRGELNVLQAVSLALGTTLVAKGGTYYVIRKASEGEYKRILVPYNKMADGKIPPMPLEVNDILYVPTSVAKSVLINGSGLIGTAATAAIYRTP
jgi:polysaccharide export outer membrane protein